MNQPGRYAASDGSFAKSASSAAARGGALIAVAVVLGFILLKWGFDGGDPDAEVAAPVDDGATEEPADEEDPSTTDPSTTDPATEDDPAEGDPGTDDGTTTSEPVVVDDPATVDVVVLNGTGEPGLAGTRGEALGAVGYTWTAGNAATTPTEVSNVFYAAGFADEAKAVAEALSGGAAVLAEAPADQGALAAAEHAEATAAADVVVVLGADQALS
jgi:hypothetical protein